MFRWYKKFQEFKLRSCQQPSWMHLDVDGGSNSRSDHQQLTSCKYAAQHYRTECKSKHLQVGTLHRRTSINGRAEWVTVALSRVYTTATYLYEQLVSGYIYVDGHMLPDNKLLVRDSCWLYLGDIITIHLCHGRLVSLCIQQQTGDKLATILLPIAAAI